MSAEGGRAVNIGPRGRRGRLLTAAGALLAGVALLLWMRSADVPVVFRSALAVPFGFAALGYFQARERT